MLRHLNSVGSHVRSLQCKSAAASSDPSPQSSSPSHTNFLEIQRPECNNNTSKLFWIYLFRNARYWWIELDYCGNPSPVSRVKTSRAGRGQGAEMGTNSSAARNICFFCYCCCCYLLILLFLFHYRSLAWFAGTRGLHITRGSEDFLRQI